MNKSLGSFIGMAIGDAMGAPVEFLMPGDFDSITVGAITGQLAGAFYGLSSIPEKWINCLHKVDYLKHLAESITGVVKVTSSTVH